MRSRSFDGMACSVADVMGAIGDRWALLVMRDVLLGISRYEDLRRSTGVTNTTLADRLKSLENNGLLERRAYQPRPVRHEYLPTERGKDLTLLLQALTQIGDKWNLNGLAGPPVIFRDRRSGDRVTLAMVKDDADDRVDNADLEIVAGTGADSMMKWRLERGRTAAAPNVDRAVDKMSPPQGKEALPPPQRVATLDD